MGTQTSNCSRDPKSGIKMKSQQSIFGVIEAFPFVVFFNSCSIYTNLVSLDSYNLRGKTTNILNCANFTF